MVIVPILFFFNTTHSDLELIFKLGLFVSEVSNLHLFSHLKWQMVLSVFLMLSLNRSTWCSGVSGVTKKKLTSVTLNFNPTFVCLFFSQTQKYIYIVQLFFFTLGTNTSDWQALV